MRGERVARRVSLVFAAALYTDSIEDSRWDTLWVEQGLSWFWTFEEECFGTRRDLCSGARWNTLEKSPHIEWPFNSL